MRLKATFLCLWIAASATGARAQDSDLLDAVEKPYRQALETMKGVFAPDAKEADRKLREAVGLLEQARNGLGQYLAKHPEKSASLSGLRKELEDALTWAGRFSGDFPKQGESPPPPPEAPPPGTYSAAEEGEELFWLVETYEKEHLKETVLIVRRYLDVAGKHPETEFGRHAMRRAAELMEGALSGLELLETGSAILAARQAQSRPPGRPRLSDRQASDLAKKLVALSGDVRDLAAQQARKAEMDLRIGYGQKRIDVITAILQSQGAKMGIEQYRKYEKEQTDWMNAVPDAKKQSEDATAKSAECRRRIDKGFEEILAVGPGAIAAVQDAVRQSSRWDLARPFLENLLSQLARLERREASSGGGAPAVDAPVTRQPPPTQKDK